MGLRGGRAVVLVLAACLAFGVVPVASAADPVPPETWLSDVQPVVPVWHTFGVRGIAGSAPVDRVECSLDGGAPTRCDPVWDPDLTAGTHVLRATAIDVNGLADPTPEEATILVDLEGPAAELAINDGQAVTRRFLVRLVLAGVSQWDTVRISSSPEVDADGRLAKAWEGYRWQFQNGRDLWRLGDPQFGGSAAEGVRTVYVQAVDQYGNWGAIASDAITVDTSVRTPVTVRIGMSENPAPLGDPVYLMAVAEAADGVPIDEGQLGVWVSTKTGSHGASESDWNIESGARMRLGWVPAGTYRASASYSGADDLAPASIETTLTVGTTPGVIAPRAFFSSAVWPDPDGSGAFELDVAARDDEPLTTQCRLDSGAWQACAGSFSIATPAAGYHVAEVRGTDKAGKTQPVPDVFVWPWKVALAGTISSAASSMAAIRLPKIMVDLQLPPDATAVRLSNAKAVDASGRLVTGRDTAVTPPHTPPWVTWDLTDAAYGGTAADGRKVAWGQFRLAGGAWTTPVPVPVVLDRTPPSITIRVENGSPWVDRDQLLVVAKSNEYAEILVTDDPAKAAAHDGRGVTTDGVGMLAWPNDVPAGTAATRTLYAVARDAAGNWSKVASDSIVIDRTAPETAIRPLAFATGSRVTTTSAPVRVRPGATDTGSGVSALRLQEVDGAATTTVGRTSAASLSVVRRLPYAEPRSFRARASDRLGHVGRWALTPSSRPVLRDDRSSVLAWSGSWRRIDRADSLRGTVRRATAAGAKVSLTFSGRAVALAATRGAGMGKAKIYVDGVRVAVIDLRATTRTTRVVAWSRSWATAARRRVTVVVAGTAGRPAVEVDAFVVLP